MTISIRLAQTSDAADIARLSTQHGYKTESSLVALRLTRLLSRPDQQFFVAEDNHHVVGWLHASILEYVEMDAFVVIGGLVVDKNQRRKGIGSLLLNHAEEWAKKEGFSIVRLCSSASRTAAHEFYQGLGYTKIKTQYAFVKSLSEDGGENLKMFIPNVDE